MKNIYWLVRRELWEHKGSMIYTPLAIAGVALALTVAAIVTLYMKTDHAKFSVAQDKLNQMIVSGESNQFGDGLITAVASPLLAIGFLSITFYFLGSLFDDRKDKSIFFWKSLPISDQETVISKLIVGLIVSPLIILTIATILFYLAALIFGIAGSIINLNLFGVIFNGSNFLSAPFKIIALLPIQFIWALPSAGWLLLVSALVKNKPLLWAIAIPLAIAILVGMALQIGIINTELGRTIIDNFVIRSFSGFMPGGWLQEGELSSDAALSHVVSQSYALLFSMKLWVGAAIGCALTFAAIELRGSNTEI